MSENFRQSETTNLTRFIFYVYRVVHLSHVAVLLPWSTLVFVYIYWYVLGGPFSDVGNLVIPRRCGDG